MAKFEDIKKILINDYENGNLKQGYILESENLEQAIKLSENLGKYILKTSDLENTPDYIFIKKDNMNVATIRKIINESSVKPYKARKIYVFEDGMNFTISMENAFLKILETPPSHAIFIINIENSNYLLDTIKSRCIKYSIDKVNTTEDKISDIENFHIFKEIFQIIKVKDYVKSIEFLNKINDFKENIELVLDDFLKILNDVVYLKSNVDLNVDLKYKLYLERLRENFTYFEIFKIIENVEKTKNKLKKNCNYKITMEVMIFNLMEVKI